jgi:serine/threonine protein kinase
LRTVSVGSEEDDVATRDSSIEETKVNFSSFTIIEELGSGSFGKVYKVFKNDTRDIYAMKALSKQNLISQN